ncbi:MAG: hypothetical protein Q7S53_00585 [bacterium]|nr:hypothetical protein [bacterium]
MQKLGKLRFFMPVIMQLFVWTSPFALYFAIRLLGDGDLFNMVATGYMMFLVVSCWIFSLKDRLMERHYLTAFTLASLFGLFTGHLILFIGMWLLLMCASGIKMIVEAEKETRVRGF